MKYEKIDNWEKIVERKRVPPTPLLWKFQGLNQMPKFLNLAGQGFNYMCYWEGGLSGIVKFYLERNSLININNYFFNYIKKRRLILIEDFESSIKKISKDVLRISVLFTKNDFKNKNNKEIFNLLEEYKNFLTENFAYIFLITIGIKKFQEYLGSYLNKQIKKYQKDLNVNICLAILSAPEKLSYLQEEKESLEKIIRIIKKDKKLIKIFKRSINSIISSLEKRKKLNFLINEHFRNFFWISHEYIGPVYTKKDIVKNIKFGLGGAINTKINVLQIKKNKLKIVKELKIDKSHKDYFNILSFFTYIKDYYNGIETQSFVNLETALNLIAKRFKMLKKNIYFLHLNEFKDLLLKSRKPYDLDRRQKYYLNIFSSRIEKRYPGNRARSIFNNIIKEGKLNYVDIGNIKGVVANIGKVTGRIRILKDNNEVGRMRKNEILVTSMTTPDYVIAIKKAKAIVTDEGGLTCHAAIISRELKIPCIVGTKVATQVLKDGDLVEVDANRGIVKKLK